MPSYKETMALCMVTIVFCMATSSCAWLSCKVPWSPSDLLDKLWAQRWYFARFRPMHSSATL